ncbi:MAG TPA: tol-pal system protein YbgF [Magnetospirillaceae bacterium]|jgi:tol-pal system protein YbgF
MKRTALKLVTAVILTALTTIAAPAWAQQQQDTHDLIDRIDRLERDLNILQSQFYRSQSNGGSGATSASSPAAGGSGTPLSGDAYSQLDQRIQSLEDQMRDLTGQLEKANHDTSEINARLDRMQGDNDVRFKELEQKAGVGGPVAANAPAQGIQQQAPQQQAQANQPGAPQSLTNQPAQQSQQQPQGQAKAEDWNPTQGSAPHPLGQMSESDLKKLTPKNNDGGNANVQAAAAQTPQQGAPKTPQEQYDAAFALLRNNDNDGATRAFQTFLKDHPKDPLAGNASFWLGQIAFAQGKFEQSAPIFFDTYTKYPKSQKAGESLLKVGLSMSNLGKKKEACAALARFTSEFPDASEGLKRQAIGEKQKLGCGG